jgi:tRNA(Ile)-lysidine synthase
MAMLHLLLELRGRYELQLYAAHFDHGVRSSSGDEAKRVRDWSMGAGVRCELGRAEGLHHGHAALREARYDFLSATARRLGANRIALAHHADDQIETILFRLGRGTGLRGIAGIPPRRGRFVRPLLPFRREDLLGYVAARGIPHLDDPSNRDRRYARSRIRHDLCPAAISEPVARTLLQLSADARAADAALRRRAERVLDVVLEGAEESGSGLQIARSKLAAYDRAEQARVLRLLACRLGHELTRGGTRLGVEFIKRGRSGRGAQIAEGLELRREFDWLLLRAPVRVEADADLRIDQTDGRGSIKLGGRAYEVAWGAEAEGGDWVARLPMDGVRFPLHLRGPRAGDRIRTRAGSRKLKKLFNEGRVPRSVRASVPVLVAADGRICWVVGLYEGGFAAGDRDEERFIIGVSSLRHSA